MPMMGMGVFSGSMLMAGESLVGHLIYGITALDQQIQHLIDLLVGIAKFILISLADPQVGGWRLHLNRLRNVQCPRQLPDLRFVQVFNRLERRRTVTKQRSIAE